MAPYLDLWVLGEVVGRRAEGVGGGVVASHEEDNGLGNHGIVREHLQCWVVLRALLPHLYQAVEEEGRLDVLLSSARNKGGKHVYKYIVPSYVVLEMTFNRLPIVWLSSPHVHQVLHHLEHLQEGRRERLDERVDDGKVAPEHDPDVLHPVVAPDAIKEDRPVLDEVVVVPVVVRVRLEAKGAPQDGVHCIAFFWEGEQQAKQANS